MRCCREFLDAIGRRQGWDARSLQQTAFRRSLTLLDLIGLGVGSCGGVGVYVLSAHVTRQEAGPSSVLSVIIAGVTALLAGLCHAELAGRLPRAGTGYTFCYVTLGELSAFVVGWTMLLEHAVTAAVAAKAWRHYLDYMVNDTLSGETEGVATWQLPEVFATHPDVLACVIMLVVSLASFLSVKAFSVVTLCLAVTSGLVLLALVCVGYFHVQAHNWTRPPGFFAFGFAGTLSGASLMMSVFTGVDQVAGASQETRDPSRHLPSALPLTTALLFLTLLLATSALTLACPWQDLAENAPIARAFETKGIYAANHVIGAGALLGLLASAMSGLFHPPRILHSMAKDGLLPGCLSKVALTSIPLLGALLSGLLASLLALTLDFGCLIEMSALGTVLQFLTSAVIVLHVRYRPDPVGLCREYSDLDAASAASMEEALPPLGCGVGGGYGGGGGGGGDGAQSHKLVLMANGDLRLHHYQDASRSSRRRTPTPSSSSFSAGPPDLQQFRRATQTYHQHHNHDNHHHHHHHPNSSSTTTFSSLVQLSSCAKLVPDAASWASTRHLLLVFLLASTCLAATSAAWPSDPGSSWWAVTSVSACSALLVASGLGVARQPQSEVRLHFKAPYVPLVPLLAVVLTCLMLASLPCLAWLRFAVWTAAGLVIYFTYGIRNSIHRSEDEQEVVLFDISNRTH
ncbi:cationic amino acid transporter 3-like [Babylonia areolata]|uniref:cationic amino acid transporter 3-like n=1 Tax=Babylonia areolata TaxID=304850 RepID=UPI003FD2324D